MVLFCLFVFGKPQQALWSTYSGIMDCHATSPAHHPLISTTSLSQEPVPCECTSSCFPSLFAVVAVVVVTVSLTFEENPPIGFQLLDDPHQTNQIKSNAAVSFYFGPKFAATLVHRSAPTNSRNQCRGAKVHM